MLVARVTYALSKRTYLYTGVGRMDNEGTAAVPLDASGSVGVGKTQNGFMAGLRHHF
jgi:predicted porin